MKGPRPCPSSVNLTHLDEDNYLIQEGLLVSFTRMFDDLTGLFSENIFYISAGDFYNVPATGRRQNHFLDL